MSRLSAWLIGGLAGLSSGLASAQGLILQLPPDGTWVRYEGTYEQVEVQPDAATGQVEIPPWVEHVTIKSVGTEMAEYLGQSTPCRWLEIKVERGRESEGKIDTGVAGLEIYKVLVPESAVVSDARDAEGVLVGYVPVIKGYRKLGAAEAKPLVEPALRLYPLAVLLSYGRNWTVEAQGVDPMVGLANVTADKKSMTLTQERPTSRTELSATTWVSPDVPFGVAGWSAKLARSVKDDREPRDAYKVVTNVTVEQKARETGTDAQSELTEK
jgi:hypothetical protein